MKKYLAEFIGTALLVFFGCGTTVAAAALLGSMGMLVPAFSTLTVAVSFGLSVTVLTLAFGKISGGHLNPVISLSLWVTQKMPVKDLLGYLFGQFAGGIAGAALLMVILGGRTSLAANGYDTLSTFGCSIWAAAIIEGLCTFALIWVVLAVREEKEFTSNQALYTGLATAVVYLFAYPFTGASANPARSLGPAIFQEGDALSQVWLFIVAPVAGALIAAVLYTLLTRQKKTKANAGVEAGDETLAVSAEEGALSETSDVDSALPEGAEEAEAENRDEAEAEMQDEAEAENYDEAETEEEIKAEEMESDRTATEAETETGDEAETETETKN